MKKIILAVLFVILFTQNAWAAKPPDLTGSIDSVTIIQVENGGVQEYARYDVSINGELNKFQKAQISTSCFWNENLITTHVTEIGQDAYLSLAGKRDYCVADLFIIETQRQKGNWGKNSSGPLYLDQIIF